MPGDSEDTANTSFWSGLPKWARITTIIFVLIALAFAFSLMRSSQAIVGSAHKRTFHIVDIAARGLETWPRDIATVAKNNYGIRKDINADDAPGDRDQIGNLSGGALKAHEIRHPDLGDYAIYYRDGCTNKTTRVSLDKGKLAGQGTRYTVYGYFTPEGQPDTVTVCFAVSVPLDRLVNMGFDDQEIPTILIVDREGTILEQLGERRLPIASIGKLTANDGLTQGIVSTATGKPAKAPAAATLDQMRNVAPLTVAGVDYLAYVKPFTISGGPQCGSGAQKGGAVASAGQCFTVALLPAKTLRRGWLSPPTIIIVGFGLALAALLALLPLIRLLLIGGTESLSGIEVLGIVLGLPAAITVATFGILFAVDVKSERTVAERETQAVAARMATQAGDEIGQALKAQFGGPLLRPEVEYPLIAMQSFNADVIGIQDKLACAKAENSLNECPGNYGSTSVPRAEAVLMIGANGKLDATKPSSAFRDNFSSAFDVSARDYFVALRRGQAMSYAAGGTRTGALCPAGSGRFTVGQVRSQTDGYDKTVIAAQCDEEATSLIVMTLGALLSPVLPDPLHYMVIDASSPDFPVLFHEARGHAGVESFADQAELSAPKAQRLIEMAGAQNVRPFGFTSRYDGERAIFSAAPIPNTPWLVLVWQRSDDADGVAGQTAARAMFSWGSISFIFLAVLALGSVIRPFGWRRFWPHESASEVYRHLAWVLSAAALALFGRIYFEWQGAAFALTLLGVLWAWREVPRSRATIKQKNGRDAEWLEAALHALPNTDSWKPHSIAMVAAIAIIYIGLLLFAPNAFWAAIVLWVFAPLYAAWHLNASEDSAEALTPLTERRYRNALLAFLACIALAPANSLWMQARTLSHHISDNARQAAAGNGIERRQQADAALWRALINSPPANSPFSEKGLPLIRPAKVTFDSGRVPEFEGLLWRLQNGLKVGVVFTCHPEEPGALRMWLCTRPAGGFAITPRRFEIKWTIFTSFGTALAVALLGLFVWQAASRSLDALAGFKVPLGAVKGRNILLPKPRREGSWRTRALDTLAGFKTPPTTAKAPSEGSWLRTNFDISERPMGLSERTLLVAPQHAVRDRLENYPESWPVDLADLFLDKAGDELLDKNVKAAFAPKRDDGKKGRALLIASGLELLLRDVPRRQAALKFLETAERRLAKGDLAGIVVIAEMSPLERILDAFESGIATDKSAWVTREELRWARLFQTFESIIFSPIDKVGPDSEFEEIRKTNRPVWRLIAELRWLPTAVIDGTIGTTHNAEIGRRADPVFPREANVYQESNRDLMIRWAYSVSPCSEEAAIDYLRSTLIEHYEQCWVASTLAERLVLEAIARGHFVNIRRALAMQSLVRRGLVVLDPSPRLMNRSFALFVQQAERPERLDEWRKRQPRSSWMAARLPLLIAIPIAVIGLTLAAAESGQELTAMISVLAAGAPALLGALFKSVRPA